MFSKKKKMVVIDDDEQVKSNNIMIILDSKTRNLYYESDECEDDLVLFDGSCQKTSQELKKEIAAVVTEKDEIGSH